MKTDTLTKAFLGVIALALVVIAGQGAFHPITPVRAASTETGYDYKFIERYFAADWQNGHATEASTWTEDGAKPPDDVNNTAGLGSRIRFLGSQGWELVVDVPFSQGMKINSNLAENGVTTREQFIFRRRR